MRGEKKMIDITILGKPVPNNTKQRICIGAVRPYAINYKPAVVKEYREHIEAEVDKYCIKHNLKPLDAAVRLTIYFFWAPPKSFSKKRRHELLGKPIPVKFDLDNLEKVCIDAISKDTHSSGRYHFLENDSRVAEKHTYKIYDENERVRIIIEEMKK